MSDAPLMIGVSGLRGIVGESLTPEVVVRYAGAFGAWLASDDPWEDQQYIVVGHDGRRGHESIYHAVVAGLIGLRWKVRMLGCVTTPTVGHAVDTDMCCAGGIVITASHNPAEWNGLKCIVGKGPLVERGPDASAPTVWEANQIIERYVQNNQQFDVPDELQRIKWFDRFRNGTVEIETEATRLHAQAVVRALELTSVIPEEQQYVIVVDSVNASGSKASDALFAELFLRHIQLHGDNSGIFPHPPEPTKENLSGEGGLCDAVPGLKADVGFAQDPDGDRLAIVDETGGYIGEEFTFVLCAVSILEAMKEKGKKTPHPGPLPGGERELEGEKEVVLCTNLSTSRMIDDVAGKYGATVVRTAVGEANVVEAMKKLAREGKDVVLGGEGNGGVIWPKVTYVRDSLGSMALVLSLMARTGKTVSELVADVPSYAIVKRKQPLAKKEDAQPTIEKLAAHYGDQRVDLQDGVRIDFDAAKAWVHVRASNTEPILRLIAEAPTTEAAEALLDEVQKLVDAG